MNHRRWATMCMNGSLSRVGFALLFANPHASIAGQMSFDEPEFLVPGHGLVTVLTADMDGDTDRDIVVVSSVDVVSLFRNDGVGRFGPVQTFAAPGFHLDAVVADLNGDAALDVALASFDDGSVSVLFNQGNGTLGKSLSYPAPGVQSGRGLAVADLDGDGDNDLLVGDAFASAKAVLLNNGAGAFTQTLPFNDGGTCIAIAIEDLDGDDDQDAVTVFNGVWVHYNNGDGTFAPSVQLSAGGGHTSVAIADLDGDDDADIAVSRSASGLNAARVFLNNVKAGAGFAHQDFPISPLARDIALADLNGDGHIDIATSHVSSVDRISIQLNVGDGTFGSATEYFPGPYPQSIALADFDADGLPDVATANQFQSPPSVGLLFNVTPLDVPGDITGDGMVDVSDLLSVINAWGPCDSPGNCPADIAPLPEGDGAVNVSDLLLVINSWS